MINPVLWDYACFKICVIVQNSILEGVMANFHDWISFGGEGI